MQFTVPGKPERKARPKVTTVGGFGRAYTPAKTVTYENFIKLCYMDARSGYVGTEALKMAISAYYPIPQSWSFTKAQKAVSGEIKPCVKPDADNVIKIVADALNKVAYPDDNVLVEIIFKKFYGEYPRLEIEITEV